MPATYDSLATTTVSGSSTNTITFSSISGSYTDLRVVLTGSGTAGENLLIRYNGITSNAYSRTLVLGDGSTATSERLINNSSITFYALVTNTAPTMTTLDIFSYSGSTNKTTLCTYSGDLNGSGRTVAAVALFRDTNAITSISLFRTDTFTAGTTASLYGILRA